MKKHPIPPINRGLLARIFSKIRLSPVHSYKGVPCWEWTARVDQKTGYGNICMSNSTYLAHRVMHHLFVSPIPTGLIIDHLCRVHHCVNPIHLEVVTHKENSARGIWTKKTGPKLKTHCKNGHALSGDNLAIHLDSCAPRTGTLGGMVRQRRACKQCAREKANRRYLQLRLRKQK